MTGQADQSKEVSLLEVDRMFAGRSGRELAESAIDAELRAKGLPALGDFQAVGLSESQARASGLGLLEGRYFSFEDACLSPAIFDTSGRNRVDRAKVAEVAKRFAEGDQHAVAEHASVEAHLKGCGACRAKFGTTKAVYG